MAYQGKNRRDMGDKQEGKEGAGEEGERMRPFKRA